MANDEGAFREKLKQAYGSAAETAPEASSEAARLVVTLTPEEVRQAEQEQERVRARMRAAQ
ncbi:MAG: hypothetical protein JO157_01900 [Acetobacteraceae bacterium]|nr:hypothetical protein [Acetobacteraceae bacterium]